MIKPTVGRVVWYYSAQGAEPHAAMITKVWGARCVNLAIFSESGTAYNNTSVTLLQDDDQVPAHSHATWMPFQKGQAAKTEALQAQLGQASSSTPQGIIPPYIQDGLHNIAKGKTAPCITPADIEAAIASEYYFVAGDGVYGAARKAGDDGVQSFPGALDLLTFCVIVLRNGFTVTGESACVSPENFDAETGRKIARANAINKVWPLEGYLLKQMLYQAQSSQ